MSSSVAWNMNVKNGAVIKIPTIDVNEAEDNTVLEENNMENAPIVNKETNDSTVIHKDEVQCPPPLSPSTSQINSSKQIPYPKRSPTPDDIDTQRKFHELCYKIKEQLMKEDEYKAQFFMSIQELYEISKFLNVPENEWQNFIPNQLSHGSPAAMSWIISLVKSSRKKDTEIDKLNERVMYLEDTVEHLRKQVFSMEVSSNNYMKSNKKMQMRNKKKITRTKNSVHANTNTLKNSNTTSIGTTMEANHVKKIEKCINGNKKSIIRKKNLKHNSTKMLDEKAIEEPQTFRSAKDFLHAVDGNAANNNKIGTQDSQRISFNGNTNVNANPFSNRTQWMQQQLLNKGKQKDDYHDAQLNSHVSFAANWNVDYSKTLRKY